MYQGAMAHMFNCSFRLPHSPLNKLDLRRSFKIDNKNNSSTTIIFLKFLASFVPDPTSGRLLSHKWKTAEERK